MFLPNMGIYNKELAAAMQFLILLKVILLSLTILQTDISL
jgi:hypothetical protein